jgi:hypothetical protein
MAWVSNTMTTMILRRRRKLATELCMEGDLFAVKERPACSVMAEEAMTCDSPLESSGLDRENGFFFRMSF